MNKIPVIILLFAVLCLAACKQDDSPTPPDYRAAFEGDFPGICEYHGYQQGQTFGDTTAMTVLVRLRDSTQLTVTVPGYQSFYPIVDAAGQFDPPPGSSSVTYEGGFVGEDSLDFRIYEGHTNYGYEYNVRAHR